MARSVPLAQGPAWALLDAERAAAVWGEFPVPPGSEPDVEATYGMLSDLVVEAFERLADEAGVRLAWVPESATVIGDPELAAEAPRFDAWRDEALAWVRKEWQAGTIPGVARMGAES